MLSFLYKLICLCFNKSVLDWTFGQLLLDRRKTQLHKIAIYNVTEANKYSTITLVSFNKNALLNITGWLKQEKSLN
jgi:hypothetical protein